MNRPTLEIDCFNMIFTFNGGTLSWHSPMRGVIG